jgi:hypothetical protein
VRQRGRLAGRRAGAIRLLQYNIRAVESERDGEREKMDGSIREKARESHNIDEAG